MAVSIRGVRLLAGMSALVSLAVVFGTALGMVPANRLPQPSARFVEWIPHLNAVLSLVAIPTIGYGWYSIRRGRIRRHRTAMATAFTLFGLFLALYLYKVAIAGPTPFGGPPTIDTYVYLPLLAVHILLAIVCVPLLYYVLLLGITQPIARLSRTDHPRVGRVAASLWLTSFALGLGVYALLYLLY